jgi:hypothetical protein
MKTLLALVLFTSVVGPSFAAAIGTLVGTGKPGYSGDKAQAVAAQLNQPFHCGLDAAGNLYVADAFNHCIRKISGGAIYIADSSNHRERKVSALRNFFIS